MTKKSDLEKTKSSKGSKNKKDKQKLQDKPQEKLVQKTSENAEDLRDPSLYTNRELSWLMFNNRILAEARDRSNPLFERMKFLSITASNLDEFFMVRVASLKDMEQAGVTKKDIAGLDPSGQLTRIYEATHELVAMQYSTYNRSLIPALEACGLHMIGAHEALSDEQNEYLDRYFDENIYPVLTPMAVDSSRPFPLIRNKTLNIGALLKKKGGDKKEIEFATVQVPSVLPRFIEIPGELFSDESRAHIILLEEVIEHNIDKLFLNYDVLCAHPYRVMRNADLEIDEDEAQDLLEEIEKQLKMRQRGDAIRLEVEEGINKKLLKRLREELSLTEDDIYRIPGPLDLTFLMKLYSMKGYDELKTKPYTPQPVPELPDDCDIFEQIKKGDVLLHHPYQSFEPVVAFIRQASKDPDVLAIKQTLYRVSGNSPIIKALAQAADNGKQVSVLVELKARFDEENNIVWARMLEQAGCHVIYGLVGLKTHSKITMVVRREEDGIRRYVHLGTGNYNDATAKLYTDLGLLTCKESIGEDATAVFNMLSGYSEPKRWNCLSLAPLWLKDKFLYLIRREKENALKGLPSGIIAKMNALCDQDIIEALYQASAAGVKIQLIVRGICSLKVGIPGVSENISVRSIVGNFLEHARIFYFENAGKSEVYMASADWMPRNLERRVEILFPILDEKLKEKAVNVLRIQLDDTLKAHVLTCDDTYEKVDKRGKRPLSAQEWFCGEAVARTREIARASSTMQTRVFTPETSSAVINDRNDKTE
ncbi:MAG: RNA degradosome polyphosphate kinase [Lachnospiraceae bacterium]|nr:RNA degradosome polyphosphate kinase [Lachnospiraceae bacterium]